MRAMGPGSVSSLLKIALDVVWWVLWLLLGACVLAALAANFMPLENLTAETELGETLPLTGPLVSLGLFAFALYLGGVLVVIDRLRKIFLALTAGDPFHPDNVRRLRFVGLMLAGLEAVNTAVRLWAVWLESGGERLRIPDLFGWFSVLVVFVLAEVFREGARLRREAELTV